MPSDYQVLPMKSFPNKEAGNAHKQVVSGMKILRVLDEAVAKIFLPNPLTIAISGFWNIFTPSSTAVILKAMREGFAHMEEQMKTIVKEELIRNTISESAGSVQAVQNWLTNTWYNGLKSTNINSLEDRKQLWNITGMVTHMAELERQLGILQQPRFAKAGFSLFVCGATLHLSLIQQQIISDPSTQNRNASSFNETLANYTKQYADFGRKTWLAICQDRALLIRSTYRSWSNAPNRYVNGWGIGKPEHYYISDDYPPGWVGNEMIINKPNDLIDARKKEMTSNLRKRLKFALNENRDKMLDPEKTFNKWDGGSQFLEVIGGDWFPSMWPSPSVQWGSREPAVGN